MSDYGPKVTKLILHFAAREAVPPGGGGITSGLEFFQNPERRKEVMAKAVIGAHMAIELIKIAPDNPYGDDDEKIAEYLLAKIEEKRNSRAAE